MKQLIMKYQKTLIKKFELNYLLNIPAVYGKTLEKKWPLIFFLHGAGERGNDIEQVKKHGIAKIAEREPDFPFIAVSPQCPKNEWWLDKLDLLIDLLEEIKKNYRIDKNRIYLTGLSMGGFGSWHLAVEYPDYFAAIVPICGGFLPLLGFPEKLKKLLEVPIWTFHGEKDEVVPIENTKMLVNFLKAEGGDIRFTTYPDAGHDSWTKTYENPELYKWLLSKTK